LGKMGEVAQGGRTVVVVSHNMRVIRDICKRSLLINRGSLLFDGMSETAITKYLVNLIDSSTGITELPIPISEIPAYALYLVTTNKIGVPTSEFRMGEPWNVTVIFRIVRFISHFIIGLGIGTVEHGPVMTIWSEPKDIQPGLYQVTYEIDVPLSESNVQFAVGLSSHELTVQYLDRVGNIRVMDIAVGDQPLRSNIGMLFNAVRPPINIMSDSIAKMVNLT